MPDTYILNLSAASHKPIFESEEMLELFKNAIAAANSTTNAKRFGRSFKFVRKINQEIIEIKYTSETPIIPERSAASCISRQLIGSLSDKEKKEMTASNGSLLSAVIAPKNEDEDNQLSIEDLSDEILIKSVVTLAYGSSQKEKELKDQLKNMMLQYINVKNIR